MCSHWESSQQHWSSVCWMTSSRQLRASNSKRNNWRSWKWLGPRMSTCRPPWRKRSRSSYRRIINCIYQWYRWRRNARVRTIIGEPKLGCWRAKKVTGTTCSNRSRPSKRSWRLKFFGWRAVETRTKILTPSVNPCWRRFTSRSNSIDWFEFDQNSWNERKGQIEWVNQSGDGGKDQAPRITSHEQRSRTHEDEI